MGGEMEVTCSEFRIYMKDLGNRVSGEQARVVVSRHGRRLFAVVSEEDLEFLQRHRPRPQRAALPEPVGRTDIPVRLDHPEHMDIEEVQRIYAATAGQNDPHTYWWRGKAFIQIRLKTGAYPDTFPDGRPRSVEPRTVTGSG